MNPLPWYFNNQYLVEKKKKLAYYPAANRSLASKHGQKINKYSVKRIKCSLLKLLRQYFCDYTENYFEVEQCVKVKLPASSFGSVLIANEHTCINIFQANSSLVSLLGVLNINLNIAVTFRTKY